jgi:hypothetical protein
MRSATIVAWRVAVFAGLRCMDGGVADASGDECLE